MGLLTTRGQALEGLARATHFVFDKTGTLTKGQLRVLSTHTFTPLNQTDCLHYAVTLEQHSEHPIARALENELTKIPPIPKEGMIATAISNHPGAGMQGEINGTAYFIGTPAFITDTTGFKLEAARLKTLQQEGNTLVLLANTQSLLAAFQLGDEIRHGARELIQALQQQG
ncbi:MAG: HAD family hydrolase, partial [Candidatus Parabeggiatoa sp.]|nr:HAD family hydrolase [Candidatus Parabeggiatoa sp.]